MEILLLGGESQAPAQPWAELSLQTRKRIHEQLGAEPCRASRQHPVHKGHPWHHRHVEQCPATPSETGGHEDSGDTDLMSPTGPLGWEEELLVPSLHGGSWHKTSKTLEASWERMGKLKPTAPRQCRSRDSSTEPRGGITAGVNAPAPNWEHFNPSSWINSREQVALVSPAISRDDRAPSWCSIPAVVS